MALYPKQVTVDEAQIARLTKTYQQTYDDIYKTIATSTDFGALRRKQILVQIEDILTQLGVDTHTFIANYVPIQYKLGADDAVAQLFKIFYPVEVKTGFNRVHKEAINALIDDTAQAFGESISGVNRSAKILFNQARREAITQKLATGTISGDTNKEIQKNLKMTLTDQGLDALVDKGGHSWSLDRYTDMLIRTKAVEARNTGLTNRLVENGVDLVVVSSHGATDVCADWEGQILSLTGATAGYDTLADAEADGLFHPNCKHAINALDLPLAKETMAWNDDTGEYEKGLIE